MFARSGNRGVCFLKTNVLEISSPAGTFAAERPAYSPRVHSPDPIRQHAASLALEKKLIDPCLGDEWDGAVAEHPDATIFHSGAWARVLRDTYRHRPQYLNLSAAGCPVAFMPMMEVKSAFTGTRGISLPFSDVCVPLVFGKNSSLTAVVDHLAALARERNWKYFEVRGALPSEVPANETFYGHRLDLTKKPNELFDGFASSVRRAIRKAESALSVAVTSDASAIPHFYRLHNQTRRRHGIPPQPFSFFEKIQEHIVKPGLGFLVLAYLDSRPIAAAVFFHFGRNALFKFGASDDRYQEYRPNNLVMWEGIKHAHSLGLQSLHFGRTDLAHAGLRRFKLSLGAAEEMLTYSRFDAKKSRWMTNPSRPPSALPAAVFRSLPLTVNRLAGTLLYPHLH